MKYFYVLLIFIPIAVVAELAHWSPTLILASSSLGMIPLAGLMGQATEELAEATGPKLGGFLNATLGNAAEHIVGVQMAMKNQMDLSLSISLGSSTQIALFVAPFLVFLSLFVGPEPMDLFFHPFEVASLGVSVIIASFISLDGESNWLEGAQLLAVYGILSVAFYYFR
jgi:Ca2+:H+ antiporter